MGRQSSQRFLYQRAKTRAAAEALEQRPYYSLVLSSDCSWVVTTRESVGRSVFGRVVISGGSGFLGSHVCDHLNRQGAAIVCIDNLITGNRNNIAHLEARADFEFIEADVCDSVAVDGPVDAVLHFASAASPVDYMKYPLETLRVGSQGTQNMLELASNKGARFMLASTSEVYGDPTISPQDESYWGHVNSVGPRSMYDEAKRFAEALTMAYRRERSVDVRLARIFNVYGPRLGVDGRVVSNFIFQALTGQDITVFGDGTQTRSFCYVDDEVEGLLALLKSDYRDPCNIGNPVEFTVNELAQLVIDLTGTKSRVVRHDLPVDDPKQRCPDISLANSVLNWKPQVDLRAGLAKTIDWYRPRLDELAGGIRG